MKLILFVCVHNSGRRQMAEALFNSMAKGKVQVISAGTQPSTDINPLVTEAMTELGIDMSGQKPKMLITELINQSQMEITMGCAVENVCLATMIPVEDWKLEDSACQAIEKVREIRDQVKAKVEKLLRYLKLS